MQAVVITKGGYASDFFGQTFNVKDLHVGGRISLDVYGHTTDFSFSEVLIVNFQEEYQKAYDNKNWNSSSKTQFAGVKSGDLYNILRDIHDLHKIRFSPKYNCPA